MNEIMDLRELGEYLKLSKSTLYKLAKRGDLPSCILGRQLRFRKSKIDAWIEDKERSRWEETTQTKSRTQNHEPILTEHSS